MSRRRFAPALLALALLLAAAAPAGAEPQDGRPVITVLGRAALEFAPDKVEMTVGFSNQAPGVAEAAQQNAQVMEKVLAAIKNRLGGAGTMQTVGYRVSPRYEWDGKRNRQVGFTAVNQVKVTLKDVKLAGIMLDEAAQAGANLIQGPSWGLVDVTAARIKVQEAALAEALAQAQALAKAAGLSLGPLKSAEFAPGEGPRPHLPPAPAMAARAAPETPVEPGMVAIAASVRCIWFMQ